MSEQIKNIADKSLILKWMPILKSCGFKECDYDLISKYCNNHFKAEEEAKKDPKLTISEKTTTLSPSLWILSKVDLNKLIFFDNNDYKCVELFTIKTNYEWSSVPNLTDYIDNCIVTQLINRINNSNNKFTVGKRLFAYVKTDSAIGNVSPFLRIFGQLYEHLKIETIITITPNEAM